MEQGVNGQVANPAPEAEQKSSDKEVNLRRLAQAKERAEQERDQKAAENAQLLQKLQQFESRQMVDNDDDNDLVDDGYVEARKLRKTLSRFEQKLDQKIEKKAEEKARFLLEEERQKSFMFRLKAEYPDFDQVVTDEAANKFQTQFPGLAESILRNPDEYERRKLAYEAIKGLNTQEKKVQEKSMQEKVDQNRRNLYFTPTGVAEGAKPMGDFSAEGKKAAFEKMKALQRQARSV
jgi:hypothetical protein